MISAPSGVPFVSCIDIDVPHGTRHQGLPSDLYAITVYCDDGLACAEQGENFEPEVTVTMLRTRPGQFVSGGRGQLAMALLEPEALLAVLRAPLEGLADRRVPLAQFCGVPMQRGLRDSLRLAASAAERTFRFNQWIEQRLSARPKVSTAQRRITRATRLMANASPAGGLVAVASAVGTSLRQLERDFDHWLGVSPSHFWRLARFQRAMKSIAEGTSLADTAIDCGFSDQPHLTRSVRRLGGETPRAFGRSSRATRAALADRLLISAPAGVVFDTSQAHLIARASGEAGSTAHG